MAKKKGRMGKIFGAIAGSPYERLLKQVDKLVEASVNDRMLAKNCLLYTSPSPRDLSTSRMPSSA